MKKINSDTDFISLMDNFENKTVIDVGCGSGNLVRWFAGQKAIVTGIDIEPMLSRAKAEQPVNDETYKFGVGENLPVENNFADYIFYVASFHHIPFDKMQVGISECKRVLKQNGKAVFIEPVPREDSYYQLVRLLDDEKQLQQRTVAILDSSISNDFKEISEDYYYFERSLNDYKNLLEFFEDDPAVRKKCFSEAEKITKDLAVKNNINEEEVRYKSIIRVNVFEKY